MLRILVNILIRQATAQSPSDPAAWLLALQSAKWEAASAVNGQITGTMVNGKSVTISAVGGFPLSDLLVASEIALRRVELGLGRASSKSQAVLN